MKFRRYLDKHKILGFESRKDYELGLYNKAVSGFWFSIEALLRYLIIRSGKTPPERPGPLISKFLSAIRDDELKKRLRDLLNGLYAMRREIDHRKKLADEGYASRAFSYYRGIIEAVSRYFGISELERKEG